MKSDFEVFQIMSDNSMDIGCHPDQLNFTRDKRGGKVTFGIANPHFDSLINQAATGVVTHYAVVYVVSKEQFDKLKKS